MIVSGRGLLSSMGSALIRRQGRVVVPYTRAPTLVGGERLRALMPVGHMGLSVPAKAGTQYWTPAFAGARVLVVHARLFSGGESLWALIPVGLYGFVSPRRRGPCRVRAFAGVRGTLRGDACSGGMSTGHMRGTCAV